MKLEPRVRRLLREEARLKRMLVKAILKLLTPHFSQNTYTGTEGKMVLFTKYKDHSLRGSYGNIRDYKFPNEYGIVYSFCGFTPDGVIQDINRFAWTVTAYHSFTVRDLNWLFKKLQSMNFANKVHFPKDVSDD